MRTRHCAMPIVLALLALILVAALPPVVNAHMAPLPSAAGSDLAPAAGTQVAMVTETVALDVQAHMASGYRAAALVTAEFTLRNLGAETESMDVRFPLGSPALRAGPIPAPFMAQDLRVYLASGEVATRTQTFDGAPWAVWPMQFPPGQDVHARVTYRIAGIDGLTYNTFFYILETGAGWRGPIGQGDIIVRFPYPADPQMWLKPPEADDALPADGYYTGSTPPFSVQGNELRWRFTNLEPSGHDNVRVSLLNPSLWQAILDAQQAVKQRPDDAKAQLRLGQAYHAAIPMKHGWLDQYPFQAHLGASANSALAKAVQMAPDDPAAHVAYATFLAERAWSHDPEPYYSLAKQELERAQALGAPASALQSVRGIIDLVSQYILTTPTPLTGLGGPVAQADTPWQPRITVVWPHDGEGHPVPLAQSRAVNIRVEATNRVGCDENPLARAGGTVQEFYLLVAHGDEPMTIAATNGAFVTRRVGGRCVPAVEYNNVPADLVAEPDGVFAFAVGSLNYQPWSNMWLHALDGGTSHPTPVRPVGIGEDQWSYDVRIASVVPSASSRAAPLAEARIVDVVVDVFVHGTLKTVPLDFEPNALILLYFSGNDAPRTLVESHPGLGLRSSQVEKTGNTLDGQTYPRWIIRGVPVDPGKPYSLAAVVHHGKVWDAHPTVWSNREGRNAR